MEIVISVTCCLSAHPNPAFHHTSTVKGLGSCFSDSCINPNLRVEAQIFTVVNDSSALNFFGFRLWR